MENFNPRSREGSDIMRMSMVATSTKFQSTLPRGERLGRKIILYDLYKFQSTLPRGERRPCYYSYTAPFVFQSTLPRGERHPPRQDIAVAQSQDFNPRSREGSDAKAEITDPEVMQFQSTLPRGERLHLLTFFRLQYGYILFHLTNKYSFCF